MAELEGLKSLKFEQCTFCGFNPGTAFIASQEIHSTIFSPPPQKKMVFNYFFQVNSHLMNKHMMTFVEYKRRYAGEASPATFEKPKKIRLIATKYDMIKLI